MNEIFCFQRYAAESSSYCSILITMNKARSRSRSHTVNVKEKKKIHLDMTDWDQNGHSTAFKKRLNAVGNSF